MNPINSIANNIFNLIPTQEPKGLQNADDKAKRKFATEFESLVLNKLFDSMESTIPDSGFDTDAASGQIKGMFWMFMSQGMAKEGGIGLADEIYNSMQSKVEKHTSVVDQKV